MLYLLIEKDTFLWSWVFKGFLTMNTFHTNFKVLSSAVITTGSNTYSCAELWKSRLIIQGQKKTLAIHKMCSSITEISSTILSNL